MKIRMTSMLAIGLLLSASMTLQAEDGGAPAAATSIAMQENAVINTDNDKSITLASDDGLTVKTVPCHQCHVTWGSVARHGRDGSTLDLKHGGLVIAMNKLPAGSSFEVQSPLAVSSVRGTKFLSRVQHNGDETVAVKEGAVSVKSVKDGAVSNIAAGQAADISMTDGTVHVRSCTAEEMGAII